jgi:hypothetical protein
VFGFIGPTPRWSEGTRWRRDALEGAVRAVGIASQTTVAVRTGSKETRAWAWTRCRGGGAVVRSMTSATDDAGEDGSSEQRRSW